MYKNPSSEASTFFHSRWTAITSGNGHSRSIIKVRIQQSAPNCFERLIHEANESHTCYSSSINKRHDRVHRRSGHLIRYTDICADQKRTAVSIKVLCSRNGAFWNQEFGKNHLSPQTKAQMEKLHKTIVARL